MDSDGAMARFTDFLTTTPLDAVACGVCRRSGRMAPLDLTLTMASAGGCTTAAFFAVQCQECGHTLLFSADAPAFRDGAGEV